MHCCCHLLVTSNTNTMNLNVCPVCVCVSLCVSVCVCVFLCVFLCANVLLTAGLLDRLHSDDPVCACGFFHRRGLHPDDCVGQRQTPQLLKGVQRLSASALLHTSLHPVEPWQRNPSIRSLIGLLSGGLYPVCAGVNSSDGFWSYGLHVTFSHMSLHNEELLWVLDWWMQDCYRQRKTSELNTAKS